ncbi:unnamed protein product [Ceutorhynchus assimilis]|uniref:RCC1 domain-containing protein 1 n=1 Tax=Ceutorhynchus assimilis TaxID=467358 RepID=A0A9N9MC65_9CUCU|nr:unnamed protein product [Ceutorhynchus assimilis]
MRILCKGFNFCNQLNAEGHTVERFCTTLDSDSINYFQLSHTFSVALINDKLYLNCNLVDKDQIDLTGVGKIKKITVSDNSNNAIQILNSCGDIFKVSFDDFVVRQLPKFVDSEDVIKNISSYSKLNAAYTEKGCLYSIPERLEFDNKDIVDMQTGREHGVLLDKWGKVFTFGSGRLGQLGTGYLEDHQNPVIVEALGGITIIQIAAGGWHSSAISRDGDLYVWGLNVSGQLGLAKPDEEIKKNVSVMATPRVVDIHGCVENNVIQVACGSRHTIVLLDNNALYGCGWNEYKQLKNDEQKNYNFFVFIEDFSQERIEKILCGPWNSAVICK